jgi:hypothetical protein
MVKRHFVSSFMRFLVIFTVLLAIAITVPTNSALAFCFQDSCNGKDPEIEGCNIKDKTTTVSEKQIVVSGTVIGYVERRKSTHCLTQWTRVIPRITGITFEEAQLQELSGLPPKWRLIVGSTVNSNGKEVIWSKMYSYVNKIHRACGTIKYREFTTAGGIIKSGTSCTT